MASVKIKIGMYGCSLAHPQAEPGDKGNMPIIEITGTDGVQPRHVLLAYNKCVVLPMQSFVIPWDAIKDAKQGDIIRLAKQEV